MFDVEISVFKTFNSEPKTTTLGQWIAATMNGGNKFAQQVRQYRETAEDQFKKGLPFITAGAVCKGGRKREDVKQRTGWIALDIDGKHNPHLEDAEAVRDAISQIVYVAYAGLSVSGNGVWGLVKVEDPQKQDLHFEQLKKDFLNRGIVLDSTKGKNPNDARFYSYDPDAYLTEDFQVYDRLPKKPQSKPRQPSHSFNSNYPLDDTRDKVEKLISKIQQQRIDITGGYHEWRDLAFALESEFGESGRDYFHAISEFYLDYSQRETDRQFTHCLRHSGSGISIGTFFHRCREYNITLDHAHRRDNGLQSKYKAEKSDNSGKINEKGYPAAWDDITLTKGTPEYEEATRHAINDADEDELEELMKRDPTVRKLINLFDGEVRTASDLIPN